MTLSDPPPEIPKKNQPINNLGVYSVVGQIGCVTLIIVFVALFAGIGLDNLLGTKPAITLFMVLGSAPLSLFITYRLAMRAVKNFKPNEPASNQSMPSKEDEKRE